MQAAALKLAIALMALAGAAALTIPTLSAYSGSTSNASSTFATAASYDTCPNQTVSAGLATGFEGGRINTGTDLVTLGGGTPAVESAVARTGSYSLRIAAAGAATYAKATPFPVPTTQTARFALRLASLPGANVNQLFTMTNLAGVSASLRYVAATQKLAIAVTGTNGGATTVVPASSTVTAGAWHVIEMRYAAGTTTHTVDWQVNEVPQTGTSIAGTATQILQSNFGTTIAETFTANFDDVLINSGGSPYPLGDGRIRTIAPNGMGTHVGAASFTDDDGTPIDATSWQRLDELPFTSTADYIQTATNGATNYVEITFAEPAETCIRAMSAVFATHAATTQSNRAKVSAFDGTHESIVRDSNLSGPTAGALRDYGKILTPATTWTPSAVSGLVARFGYVQDSTPPPILDGIMLEYEVPQ